MSAGFYSVLLVVLSALIVRWSVSLGPYSGKGKPPMFGDYEAQRHWMEITFNLPIHEWYMNSTNNDLLYWGLDYPPLTAYHSWLCGFVAHKINPDWVALNSSRGYESAEHQLFMRYTALIADMVIYFPAVFVFCFVCLSNKSAVEKALVSAVMLLYPGLLLIDHGHFQYNSVSLGFALWGVVGLATNHDLLGSIAFSLALNYKQMELYHALPFFCYLLGTALKMQSKIGVIVKVIKLGVVVIATFVLCWFPFLTSMPLALQVLHRLFPFARGLFEDKVANFWCALSVVIKVKNLLTQAQILKLSLWSTLLAALPSSMNLLRSPSIDRFVVALVNSSLAFFLFSYQVHEKSVLLAALPVCLLMPYKPLVCVWFLIMSTFSMWPLLLKDGLALAYIPCMLLFYTAAHHLFNLRKTAKSSLKVLFALSVLGAFGLHVAQVFVKPPPRYPDLYPVLISVYSCAHLLCFYLYFNYLQFTLPYFPRAGFMKQKSS